MVALMLLLLTAHQPADHHRIELHVGLHVASRILPFFLFFGIVIGGPKAINHATN
jgi:hypothetical protein